MNMHMHSIQNILSYLPITEIPQNLNNQLIFEHKKNRTGVEKIKSIRDFIIASEYKNILFDIILYVDPVLAIVNKSYYDRVIKLNIRTNISYIPKLHNLKELNIENNISIRVLPVELINLVILNCNNSAITRIPASYVNLEELYIRNTKIKSIPDTITKLRILYKI